MKSHIESWHNGFGTYTLKAIGALIAENSQLLTTKELIADEIATHLAWAAIMTTPDHTYYTYAYQWSDWSENPAKRNVCVSLSDMQYLSYQSRAL